MVCVVSILCHACNVTCRLRMMQASTPGPGPSRTRTAVKAGVSSRKGAATAPRLRSSSLADPESDLSAGAQPLASAENGRASSTVLESSPGPVLLVLDGELQALPWESVPGLQQQRCEACRMVAAQGRPARILVMDDGLRCIVTWVSTLC